ncbi:NAD-dependent epimerase/dehydratase family protein [Streptomyces sp. NPDC057638]|uniref:NAD-dependent epimerase/dehydratase family protein n=1 Tax=Streptomyces sp. NPDC057638 TaxID=3346190 RepID=UPI00369E7353
MTEIFDPAGFGAPGTRPRVTVLGASGFLGSTVTTLLARSPIALRLVARRPSAVPADAVAEVEVRAADLTDRAALAEAVADSDVIMHLVCHRSSAQAWRTGDDPVSERVNVGVARDLVEAVRAQGGPPPVCVFAGSTSQVGLAAAARVDGTEEDHPASGYDRHKLAAERALLDATREGVLRGISLRLPTVYGECPSPTATDGGVVTAMARRALAGQPLTVWRDGAIGRDLLHVEDAARALLAAPAHAAELAGRHWLVGTGRTSSLADLFASIARVASELNGRPPVPVVTVEPPEHASAADFQSFTVDSSAFWKVTGWEPAVTSEEGLARTVGFLAGTVTG